MQWTR